jgi:DNA-binding MarR family transcriptional regulator/GNAT superfamily N-acetyltransferase
METDVQLVRQFNRAWSVLLGLLDQGLLETPYSLTEARVIFELAQQPVWERLALRAQLGIDASFLTRVLGRLQERGVVEIEPSPDDGRALTVRLTAAGRRAFKDLNQRSRQQVAELLDSLSPSVRHDLVESLGVARHLLTPRGGEPQVSIRALQPGDLGWVVSRHGAVYADEFGWNTDFEALVATIVAKYHDSFKPGRENAWIAEVDGARAGCVFCCERDADTAQLRILLVERWARGLDLGRRLVDECIEFARATGYRKVVLWTNDVLVAARRIYQAAGFELIDEEAHRSFGHDLIGQTWQLDLLRPGARAAAG